MQDYSRVWLCMCCTRHLAKRPSKLFDSGLLYKIPKNWREQVFLKTKLKIFPKGLFNSVDLHDMT